MTSTAVDRIALPGAVDTRAVVLRRPMGDAKRYCLQTRAERMTSTPQRRAPNCCGRHDASCTQHSKGLRCVSPFVSTQIMIS
jgi:hypothetical protein